MAVAALPVEYVFLALGLLVRLLMSALRRFNDDLWVADGPVIRAYGFQFPTRMAIARLSTGELWIWSPIRLDDGLRAEVSQLGEPRYAVEPNKLHHLALSEWISTWPSLSVFAPPGLCRKRRDIHFAGELADEAPPQWRDEIEQVVVQGSFALTEVLFFHRASSTCLIGDLIEQHDEPSLAAWQRWFARTGGVGRDGGTAVPWRWTFLRRAQARSAIARAIEWSPQRLVIAHGSCPIADGTDALRRHFRWLLHP